MAHTNDMRVLRGGASSPAAHSHASHTVRSSEMLEPMPPSADERAAARAKAIAQPTLFDRVGDAAGAVAGVVRGHPWLFTVLATIVVVLGMLYGPVRDWYVSMRSGQDLQTYYAAVETQNGELREDLGRLQTHEGIEDEARKRGYINPDETGVLVVNLPGPQADLPEQLEVDYETTWDQAIFDFIFGYKPGEWR